ncbi:MAG: DNA translocase FtsK [Chloroflexota bacterium]
MGKRKADKSGKSGSRLGPRWVLGFILLCTVAVLLVWQWSNIVWLAGYVADRTLEFFGWGLLLVALFLITLGAVIGRWGILASIRHWNRWLGAAVFIFAIWGILAFFPGEGGILGRVYLGGNFGQTIIGYPNIMGILRVLGVVVVGVFLVAPRGCFRLAGKAVSWIGRRPARQPANKYMPQQKIEFPRAKAIPQSPYIKGEGLEAGAGKEGATPSITPVQPQLQPQSRLQQIAQEVRQKYLKSPALITVDGWQLPPIDILDRAPEMEFSQADNMHRAKLIEEALASYGVAVKVVQINTGPTVTQFGVEPGWDRKMREVREKDRDGNVTVRLEEVSKTRVKVDRITSLANDMALALAAPSIRIEAPVPGKSVVGIEVPNTIASLVSLRGVIESSTFQKQKAKSKLSLALGQGAGGESVAADLSKMPHILIAGATGSGKTVCLNTLICCLLLHNTPNEARFIMIDPKRVELTPFNSIPHLATPVIVDTTKALASLRWLSQELDRRYQKLAAAGVRNIEGYNKNKYGDERLPYLILVVDELADLMMAGFDEVEHTLCRLAQLSRAAGIHIIVATQRPSVDVVTGLIKANFPTRISFAVTSQVDSRTILDCAGAEKLQGRGDMLYMPTEAGKPKRLQGCYVSDMETERLVYFWGNQRQEELSSLKIDDFLLSPDAARKETHPADPLMETARQLLEEHGHISTSFLQRRLRIGYPRAARLMEQLEEEGIEKGEE